MLITFLFINMLVILYNSSKVDIAVDLRQNVVP